MVDALQKGERLRSARPGRWLVAALLVVALVRGSVAQAPVPAPSARQQAAETIDSLRSRISAHVSQPRFAPAAWGVKIVSLDTGKTIFEHNPEKYFSPASNAKLYSTALALERLGGDYRIKTSLYTSAQPDPMGVVKGDLIVYGRGDPTMAAD